MAYHRILIWIMFLIIATSCNQDENEINDQDNLTYTLQEADYQWMAKTDLGDKDQLENLSEINGFKVAGTNSVWSENEISTAINSLLFVFKQFDEGLTYKVFFQVYDGSASKEESQTLEIKRSAVRECDNIACVETIEKITLTESDYQVIVSMNKGSLDQLDNIGTYKTFNMDPSSHANWEQSEVEYALNGLLLHHFGKEIDQEIEVVYDAYNGTEVVTLSSIINVFDTSPFDVRNYDETTPSKSNATDLYVHYMPWYESKDHNGYWGSHWTMANQNPDIITDGKRQIASHFYPLIGPYGSSDPDLIDYHLLLMKYSGIDGILIDWYGTYDVNDYAINLENSNALIDKTDELGLKYAIVYEDRTTENVVGNGLAKSAVEAATADFSYIKSNYIQDDNYIMANNLALLLTFTPVYINSSTDWNTIITNSDFYPTFLAIWEQSSDLGSVGSGEYSWVYNGNNDHIGKLDEYYGSRYPTFDFAIGSAYPGFKDFYQEGGWGEGIGWEIIHNNTSVLNQTLNLASLNKIEAIQLVTWNDFGEGTMIEPTKEFGYSMLEVVQDFAAVSYSSEHLEQIFKYYTFRKEFENDQLIQLKLDQVFQYLNSLQVERATSLLESI